jgi:TM2 domain-containing membrane protein YozV
MTEVYQQQMSWQFDRGSTGNVIAAVCSFFFPGLGQLVQARPLKALFHFVLSVMLWFVFLGWIMHLWSAFEAARYDG